MFGWTMLQKALVTTNACRILRRIGSDPVLPMPIPRIAFGAMVGCDNDDCRYQWFQWMCVRLESEPSEQEWLSPERMELGDAAAFGKN